MDDTTATRWAIDELVRLIEIPSVSDREHEAMEYLASRCRELDLPTETQSIPGAGPNVLVSWSDHPALLLTAHIDTIVPTWVWDGRAQVDGTVVRGLGAQDDKGCAIAILLGLLIWNQLPDTLSLVGIAILASAGIYTFYREQKLRRVPGR